MRWNSTDRQGKYHNPVLEKKKMRLKIVEGILRNNCPMKCPKAIAIVVYNTGVSEKKAMEYLRNFVNLDIIKIEDSVVYLIKDDKIL